MNRCSPVKMRENLKQVDSLAKAGVDFIPVPVTSDRVKQLIELALIEAFKELDKLAEDSK